MKIKCKCVGCGNVESFDENQIEQPFCKKCGNLMIAQGVIPQ